MSEVSFLPLAVNPDDYPRPFFSMLPSVSRLVCFKRHDQSAKSAFLGRSDFFIYGRYALVEALKRAGAGPNRAVLLPAYHCRTIVESALYIGAEIRFYPMKADLKPDFASMDRLFEAGNVSALLVTNYFGFANALKETREFCDRKGIAMIEDCAHSFYGEHEGIELGTAGDYAIASAWKFLPVRDGAMLRDNNNSRIATDLKRQSILREMKSCIELVTAQFRPEKTGTSLPDPDGPLLVSRAREIETAGVKGRKVEAAEFHPRQVDLAGLKVSRWSVLHSPHDRVGESRRMNYKRWLDGIRGLSGVEPLFAELPDGVVPYAFPLLTDSAGLIFHALKLAGIPIWRWEDVAETDCPVARNYRLRLLQLPCHQDLTAKQIDWMLAIVRAVLFSMNEPELKMRRVGQ